jgi:hypothetical protein
MATSRRKTAGFTAPETEEETASVERLLEENAAEMFETISQTESVTETKPVEAAPFVEQEIIPTEDVGPRFVEELLPPSHAPNAVAPKLKNPPKRHPRNIPKFSRFK